MEKRIVEIITCSNGVTVIDATEHAKRRVDAMDFAEKRYKRERRKVMEKKRKLAKNPIYKIICILAQL